MSTDPDAVEADRIRRIVREELAEAVGDMELDTEPDPDEPSATRRQVLGGLAAGGLAGLVGGAGAASAETGVGPDTAMVGNPAPNVYRWADPDGYAGPNSARTNITPETGALFFGWDNGAEAIYRGNSGAWEQVADLGAIGTGGAAAPTTVLGGGDSLEDAINEFAYPNGAWAHLKPDYDVTVETLPVQVDPTMKITGEGWGENTAVQVPNGETFLNLGTAGSTNQNDQGIELYHLRIEGGDIAIQFENNANCNMQHVLMKGQDQHGVLFDGDFSGWLNAYHCVVIGHRVGPGWELRSDADDTPPNNATLLECGATDGGDGTTGTTADGTTRLGTGVALGGFGVTWRGGNVEENDGPAIMFDGGELGGGSSKGSYLVDGTYFESNAETGTGTENWDADIWANPGTGDPLKIIKHTEHRDAGNPAADAVHLDQNGYFVIDSLRGPNRTIKIDGNAEPVWIENDDPVYDLATGVSSGAHVVVEGVVRGGTVGGADLDNFATDVGTADLTDGARVLSVGSASARDYTVWTWDSGAGQFVSPDGTESNITPA